jgi:hypothetical protein
MSLLLNESFLIFLLVILNGFLIKKPFPQILCIFHTIFHALAIKDDYNEPSAFYLEAAGKTRPSSISYSRLDADV